MVPPPQAGVTLNNYCWLFLANVLGVGLFAQSDQIKEKKKQPKAAGEVRQFSRDEASVECKTNSAAAVASRLLVFTPTVVARLLVFKTVIDLRAGNKGKSK